MTFKALQKINNPVTTRFSMHEHDDIVSSFEGFLDRLFDRKKKQPMSNTRSVLEEYEFTINTELKSWHHDVIPIPEPPFSELANNLDAADLPEEDFETITSGMEKLWDVYAGFRASQQVTPLYVLNHTLTTTTHESYPCMTEIMGLAHKDHDLTVVQNLLTRIMRKYPKMSRYFEDINTGFRVPKEGDPVLNKIFSGRERWKTPRSKDDLYQQIYMVYGSMDALCRPSGGRIGNEMVNFLDTYASTLYGRDYSYDPGTECIDRIVLSWCRCLAEDIIGGRGVSIIGGALDSH